METHIHKKMTKEMAKLLRSHTDADNFFNKEKINGHKIIDIIAQGSYIEDNTAGVWDANRGDWNEQWEQTEAGDNRFPTFHHFWNQSLNNKGLTIVYSNSKPAYRRAEFYWNKYIKRYSSTSWNNLSSSRKEEALLYFGRIIHLLQDMATPAHTNDDPHLSGDNLEEYVGKKWRYGTYTLDNRSQLFYNNSWSLYDYFYNMAKETIKYDSDDVDGTGEGFPYRHEKSYSTGYDLTDSACNTISNILIPKSYEFTASLLLYFYNMLNINSRKSRTTNKKYNVIVKIIGMKVANDQDYLVLDKGDAKLRIVNGEELKKIDLGDNSLDGGEYKNLLYNNIVLNRTIARNESMNIYYEVLDKDSKMDELIARKQIKIDYSTFRNYINTPFGKKYSNNDIIIDCEISAFEEDTAIYEVTAYIESIYVKYDEDYDYSTYYTPWHKVTIKDVGELYAKCNYNGKYTRLKLGDIGTGETKRINKKIWSDTVQANSGFNFHIQVMDEDYTSADDSLGTVNVHIDSSELDLHDIASNEGIYVTKYLKTRNPYGCKLKFKLKVREVQSGQSPIPPQHPIILPTYKDIKKKKVIEKESDYIYLEFNENQKKTVLHYKKCVSLQESKKDRKIKKIYLTKTDVDRLKKGDIEKLHPNKVIKEIKKKYNQLSIDISKKFISKLELILVKNEIKKSDIDLIKNEIHMHINNKSNLQKESVIKPPVSFEEKEPIPINFFAINKSKLISTGRLELYSKKEFKHTNHILEGKEKLQGKIFGKLKNTVEVIKLYEADLKEKIDKHNRINKDIDTDKLYTLRKEIVEATICPNCGIQSK